MLRRTYFKRKKKGQKARRWERWQNSYSKLALDISLLLCVYLYQWIGRIGFLLLFSVSVATVVCVNRQSTKQLSSLYWQSGLEFVDLLLPFRFAELVGMVYVGLYGKGECSIEGKKIDGNDIYICVISFDNVVRRFVCIKSDSKIELLDIKTIYDEVDGGKGDCTFVTNSYFMPESAVFLRSTGVEMLDRNSFSTLLSRKDVIEFCGADEEFACPLCHNKLFLRKTLFGTKFCCHVKGCGYKKKLKGEWNLLVKEIDES